MRDRLGKKPQQEPARLIWDTSLIRPRDRYAYFREGLCQVFLSFTPEGVEPSTLSARMRKLRVPGGLVSTTYVSPHRVRRTATDRARLPGELLIVGTHLRGSQCVEVQGTTYEQPLGSLFMLSAPDLTVAEITSKERFLSSAIIFDKGAVEQEVGPIPPYVDIRGPYAAPLRACLQMLCERFEMAKTGELENLFDAARSLIVSHLLAEPEGFEQTVSPLSSSANGLLVAITRLMQAELGDENLSATTISQRFGISPRYVHKLFAAENTSVGRELREMRLHAIYGALRDPSRRDVPIGMLSAQYGFRDEATFYRNFKARFDETPTQVRSRRDRLSDIEQQQRPGWRGPPRQAAE